MRDDHFLISSIQKKKKIVTKRTNTSWSKLDMASTIPQSKELSKQREF
jgi:hypothetical protein